MHVNTRVKYPHPLVADTCAIKHPLYRTWYSMLSRCYQPTHASYKYYGGKGVGVHKKWFSFQNFVDDVGLKPGQDYELDRINTAGNYGPGKCRWLTKQQNQANKMPNAGRKYKGVSYVKSENKWMASIKAGGMSLRLGAFETEKEAAACYNITASEWFGQYARLNKV